MEKLSPKVKSEALLHIKDIEKFKKENVTNKLQAKALKIEESLEKYNKAYIKAWEAPIPDISLHFNEVLVRAVPKEIKAAGGLILNAGTEDFRIAGTLDKMSHAVDLFQEILMVGPMITEEEQKRGIRPGRICKMKLDRFRGITDHHTPGVIETEYNIPLEMIDGHKYIIIDKRDILYTKEK